MNYQYSSNLATGRREQGKSLNQVLSEKRGVDVNAHFAKALTTLWSTDMNADFEALNSLLIEDLSMLAIIPGKLSLGMIRYRKFLLERAGYEFRSSLVSKLKKKIQYFN
jgi:hypothetical protein